MLHKEKRMAGRYVPAFSWHGSIDEFLRTIWVRDLPGVNVPILIVRYARG